MQKFIATNLLKKKRAGESLSRAELEFLVNGFTQGEIPDYQMSAFLMATYFQGMSHEETADLVAIMRDSGAVVDLSSLKRPKIDKHSTGGLGDKTTLILAPLLASCGFAYPTLAGRGLGHTGGTVDKLAAIPGFRSDLSLKRFAELVSSVGLAFLSQTEEICPADRKIYALRDVTATVESLPLIVASIMSKKFAEGIDGILFDIKCGSGAFMKTPKEALALGKALVATAQKGGKSARALVTEMAQPLGHAVGNAIEVNECVAFLRQGPQDAPPNQRLWELTLELATELYLLASPKTSRKKARAELEESLRSGKAYAKFLEIVSMQGGDTHALDEGLPIAHHKAMVVAPRSGVIQKMEGEAIGMALVELGGGRKTSSDSIDPAVGFWFEKFLGQKVKKGEVIAQIFASSPAKAKEAQESLQSAVFVGSAGKIPPLILKRI